MGLWRDMGGWCSRQRLAKAVCQEKAGKDAGGGGWSGQRLGHPDGRGRMESEGVGVGGEGPGGQRRDRYARGLGRPGGRS